MLSRTITAVLAVATALAVGSVGCHRTPPDEQRGLTPPLIAAAPPWFEDVTDAVGLNFTHDCGPTGTYFMPQSMYGGGALFDADGDGRLDILLLQGAGPNTGVGNRLYLQTPDGKFRDASAGSGLDFDGWNVGVAIGDVDLVATSREVRIDGELHLEALRERRRGPTAEAVAKYEADPAVMEKRKKPPEASPADKAASMLALADNYATAGKTDEARAKYKQVLKDYADTPAALKATKRLADLDKPPTKPTR